MENSNIIEKALDITNKFYPEISCALLTGSQIESEFRSRHSDVDIVLIDSCFSNVSSDGLIEDNYKIDFTRVGTFNLIDILIENAYAVNPIIINMFKGSVILKDETGIGQLAQEFCQRLFDDGNKNYKNEIEGIKHGLVKLRKHLLKNLDHKYIPFLLADFVRLIASANLILNNNGWFAGDGFRLAKSIFIKDKNSKLLESISRLTHDYMDSPYENTDIMLSFIDRSFNSLNAVTTTSNGNLCIINLDFRNQSFMSFHCDVCNSLKNHPYIGTYFIFGQKKACKSTHRYQYCLYFKNNLQDFNEVLLMQEIHLLFAQLNKRILNIQLVDSWHLQQIFIDDILYKKVVDVFSFINDKIVAMTQNNNLCEPNERFLLGLVFSSSIIHTFGLSKGNLSLLTKWLTIKWRPDDFDQHLNSRDISTYSEQVNNTFNDVFKSQHALFDSLKESGISVFSDKINKNDLREFSALCEDIVHRINDTKIQLPQLYLYTIDIPGISNITQLYFWNISYILKNILDIFEIEETQRSYFAFVLSYMFK